MALKRRPHSIAIESAEDLTDGASNVLNTAFTATQTVKGQITPERASSSFERWGVEVAKPHLCLVNVEDAEHLKIGDRAKYGVRLFRVIAGPSIWDAVSRVSCAALLLDEITVKGDA